jgi:transposase
MADQQHSTPDVNLVAIDIAKEWNIALVEETTGKRRSFKFANRPADYQSFVQFLHALPGPVRVAFEPTGDYHRALGYRLL